jgi:hypothetical protein
MFEGGLARRTRRREKHGQDRVDEAKYTRDDRLPTADYRLTAISIRSALPQRRSRP